ncbi:MAG: tRNA-splicing ligase RtcB, partial [Parcubacteria group bacterium Gr01-1014_70]
MILLLQNNTTMNSNKIQSIGCNITNPKFKQLLEHISSLPAIAKPIVCLPDIHLKENTEAPCSFVAAANGVIIPELTAPSVGCGMGIVITSLKRNDITPEKLEEFYKHMQEHRSIKFGTLKNILLWLGIIDRPRAKYDFSKKDLADAIRNGAKFAAQKYNMPPETLEHIEYNGDVMDESAKSAFPPEQILPRAAWASGRHDIGYGFKGNHFLEVQFIEHIPDEKTAASWGLSKDQVVIMYHGGGGAVSHYLGRYFAKRKKDSKSFKTRLFQFAAKFLFHFSSWEGIRNFRARWMYYFHPAPFQAIPANDPEGKRLMASIKASLNYSYAFRLAILKRVQDALQETFVNNAHSSLLWDSVHNSIHEEKIDGKEYIVHRHTATRVFDGRPVLISGFNNT